MWFDRPLVWLLLLAVAGYLAVFTLTVYVFGLDALDRSLVTGFGLLAGVAVVWYLIRHLRR